MKKQVPVEQLKFGAYVYERDRPWTDTPFMYQGFVINSEAQMQALKKYCKRVYIDTAKGSDIIVNPFAGGPPIPGVLGTIKEKATYEEVVQVKLELPVARQAQ